MEGVDLEAAQERVNAVRKRMVRESGASPTMPIDNEERRTAEYNASNRLGRSTLADNGGGNNQTRLTFSQTIVAIVLAIVNYLMVVYQERLGGRDITAVLVGGSSLLVGSIIPFARC